MSISIQRLLMIVALLSFPLQAGLYFPTCFGQRNKKSKPQNIFQAVAGGDLGLVQKILTQNGNVNADNYLGNTILNIAAQHGHFEVVEFLLNSGSNPNTTIPIVASSDRPVPRVTPLYAAALRGDLEMCHLLVKFGACLSVVPGTFLEYSPLSAAQISDNQALVSYLIKVRRLSMVE